VSTELEAGDGIEPSALTRPDVQQARPFTTRAHRIQAMALYVVAFLAWTHFIGLPNDPIWVFLWIWFAGIAWNIDAPRAYHLRFPADWWPVLLGLVVYWFTRGLADNDGIPIHVMMPIHFDTWFSHTFGIGHQIPTVALQHSLCGTPCTYATPTHWYDLFFSAVYATHFFLGLTMAAVLWVRNRDVWRMWMRRYLTMNYAALVIYFLYPMEPPWMASAQGHLPVVHRVTSRGFTAIGLDRANVVLQGMGNQVAAMPSLHAGTTFLIAFWGIWRLRSAWRFLLLLYPLAMCVALIYSAEHYVVDVLAGGLLAGVVMAGCWGWERWRLSVAVPEPVVPLSPA
jgi:hypothetical protein